MAKIILDTYPNTTSECPFCGKFGICKLEIDELCKAMIKDEHYPLDPYVNRVDLNKCSFVTIATKPLTSLFG